MLVLPLLLGLDVVWLSLFLFVLVFGYATLDQKVALSVALVVLVALFPALDRFAYEFAISSSPILRGAEAMQEARYDQRVLDNLEAAKNIAPDDVDIRFLLGRLYQALGQNDRATLEYTAGAQLAPRDTRCLVNRGNIRFVDGDLGSSQEDYQQALKRDPRSIAARYNLALLYAETFRTVEAAQTLQEARALDAYAVQRFQDTPTLVKVVSIGYSPDEARRKIEEMERVGRSRRLLGHYRSWDPFGGFRVPLVIAFLVAVAAAWALDSVRRRGRGYASECQKCGRAFCRLCKPSTESALLCSQCIHVYLKKDGVAIETKLQKLDDVRRRRSFEERLRGILNAVFPGAAAFLDSRLPLASLAFGLFAFGLLAAFWGPRLAVLPRPTLSGGLLAVVFWCAVALAGWLIGAFTSPRKA